MLENKVKELVEELVNTREYHLLKQATVNLEKNAKLKKTVEDFFKDNEEGMKKEGGASREWREAMNERYKKMLLAPEIAAYFNAGQKFDMRVMKLHELIDKMVEEKMEKE